jgi:hypothetical protein
MPTTWRVLGSCVPAIWLATQSTGLVAQGCDARLGFATFGDTFFTGCPPRPFTDNSLVSTETPVRRIHLVELRSRINAARAAHGLAAFSFTDAALESGVTVVRAVHVTDLREALAAVYTAAGRQAPVYTDSTLASGMAVRLAHISELRAAVVAVE